MGYRNKKVCMYMLKPLLTTLKCVLCSYNPGEYCERNAELRQCIDAIAGGYFSPEEPGMFSELVIDLLTNDK